MKKIILYSIASCLLFFSCKEDEVANSGYAYYESNEQTLAPIAGGDVILPIVTNQTTLKVVPDEGSEWVTGSINNLSVTLHLEENTADVGREGTGILFVGEFKLPFKLYQRSTGVNHIEIVNPTTDPDLSWTASCSDEQASDGGGVDMIFTDDQTTFWHSQYSPMVPLPHWIIVDLKDVKTLNQVRLGWRKNGEKSYVSTKTTIIQTSTDGENYTDVGTITREKTSSSIASVDYTPYTDCAFDDVQARYVRLYMTESNSTNGTCNVAYFKAYMP